MTSDPIRLFEDPSSAASLRGDLASATAVKIEGLDHAAGLAALESGIAAGSSAAGSGAGLSLLSKAGLGAVAVAGALVLWLGLGDSETEPPPVASPVAEVTPDVRAPAAASQPSRTSPVPAVLPTAPESEPPEPEVTPEVIATEPEPATTAESAVASPPQELRRKGRTLRRTTPTSGDAPFDDSVLREARMVAKARSSLASDPERTFGLTEQAEKDFPDGQLVEERRALAIEALAALGRTEEAERRADRFLARYGRGAHAAAVRRALGR